MRAAVLSAAALLAGSASAVDCVKGLHIIVGRGTGEPEGLGETGALARNITTVVPNSDISAVDYPASLTDPEYTKSEELGSQNVYDQVTEYHKACPGHKMAYLGWSQGAQIAVNAFCGGQGGLFGNQEAIPADAVKDVVAISIFGDPSHNKSAPFNKGTSTSDGLFVRNGIGACAKFTDKIVSYCDTGDIYCDVGKNRSVHGLYLVNYPKQMLDFVVSRYEKSGGDGNSTTGSNATSTTAAPSNSGSATGNPSSSPSATDKPNGAAGVSAGLMVAVPAAMVAAAQLFL